MRNRDNRIDQIMQPVRLSELQGSPSLNLEQQIFEMVRRISENQNPNSGASKDAINNLRVAPLDCE